MYNNHFELEPLEPPNKDGYLGSFHEMLSNRVSLNTRKLNVCGEEVLESKIFLFHPSRSFSSLQRTWIYILRETCDFFTQFLDRSNWENHWSHYTLDFRTTSGLFSLVRRFDLKVFRLSLINYNTFLFHSALVNHYIAKSATLIKRAVFTGCPCDRLLVIPVRQDWLSRASDYSCHESILYSFGYFKRANFNWSIKQQNFEFDNWRPFNFTYLFCNLFSRVNLAFLYCKTSRKIVWGILRRQLLSK